MKSVWIKAGAVALAGVAVANAFIPYAFALDVAPSETTTEEQKVEEHFAAESKVLDFGRVTELGRSYTKPIVVNNNTSNDVIIDAVASAYTEVGANNQKLSEWVTFVGGVTHFSVASGASREVNIRIVVPADATAGTQYANVEFVDSNAHKEIVLVKVDIAGDDLKYASSVEDAQITPVQIGDTLKGSAIVKNTGTAGFTSTYQIRTKNFFGGMDWNVVKQVEEEVFPGKQVEFATDEQLGFGIYSVEQRVTFVNSEGRMVESLLSRTVVNLPWWSLAIAGGVIVLIILIIVVAKRRKHNKSREDKLRSAERNARKTEIARVEHAEEKALKNSDDSEQDDDVEDEELDAIEAFSNDDSDEIDSIAHKLEPRDGAAESDASYDEEEAVPIKVNVKKRSKK